METSGRTLRRVARASLLSFAILLFGGTAAHATGLPPVYPVPAQHGGDKCEGTGSAQGASGATWTYGGGDGTTPSSNCTDTGPIVPFDTTKFQSLYWGVSSAHLPFAVGTGFVGGYFAFNGGASDPANGKLVYTTADGGAITLLFKTIDGAHTAIPLVDAATAGVDPSVGYVVAITPSLTNFQVNFAWTYNGVPFATWFQNDHCGGLNCIVSDFVGAFYYVDRPPAGSFTFTAANHAPTTFSASGLTDPDGTVASYSWDFNGDGVYGDSANTPNPSTSFGPGDHQVGLEIVDDENTKTHVIHTVQVTNAAPVADFSCTPAAPVAGETVTCTAADSDPDAAAGDPALVENWDWDGNGSTGDPADKSGHEVTGTFPAGATNVALHVIDRDGAETIVTHTVTATAPPTGGTAGTGTGTGPGPGTGTGPGSGPGSGSDTGADTTAPVLTLVIPKQKRAAALKKGLAVKLSASEAAGGKLTMSLAKALANKLKIKGPVGSLSVTFNARGQKSLQVKFSKAAAKKLKRLKKLSLVLSGTFKDGAGNTAKFSKPLVLK